MLSDGSARPVPPGDFAPTHPRETPKTLAKAFVTRLSPTGWAAPYGIVPSIDLHLGQDQNEAEVTMGGSRMSIARWAIRPVGTAKAFLAEELRSARYGDIVSVKAAIEAARRDAPYLQDTDDELMETIIELARELGLAVLFDSRD